MKSKIKNFKKKYGGSWRYVKESKNYIFSIVIIFLFFLSMAVIFPTVYTEKILEILKGMLLIFEGKNLPETISLIFLNNARASLFSILLGLIFGIFPIISAIFNGYVVGFVINKVVAEEGFSVIWKLLPHGIFELPAVFISMGLGLRIGAELFKKNPEKNLKRNFKESMKTFFLIVLPLLLIAAIIEGTLIFLFA